METKLNTLLCVIVLVLIECILFTNSIQVLENTTKGIVNRNNKIKSTNAHGGQEELPSLTDVESTAPVIYPSETKQVQNQKNSKDNGLSDDHNKDIWVNQANSTNGSAKNSLNKNKKQTSDDEVNSGSKINSIKKPQEFKPSPEIKLSISEDIIHHNNYRHEKQQQQQQLQRQQQQQLQKQHHKENDSFKPMMDSYSASATALPTASTLHIQQIESQYQQHLTQNVQAQPSFYSNQQINNNLPPIYHKINKDHHIAYGKNNYEHLKDKDDYHHSNNINNNNNIINWPQDKDYGKISEISSYGGNWENQQQHQQQHKDYGKISDTSAYGGNWESQLQQQHQHQQQHQQLEQNRYSFPSEMKIINENLHQNQNQEAKPGLSTHRYIPASGEHPYKFEVVSDRDTKYKEPNNQFHRYKVHEHNEEDHLTKHYESDVINSNEEGTISTLKHNYGEMIHYDHNEHNNHNEHNDHNDHSDNHYGYYPQHQQMQHHKPKNVKPYLYWKKIAGIIASIIPIGLLFSALTPNVVVINPNATTLGQPASPFTLVQPTSRQRSLTESLRKFSNSDMTMAKLNAQTKRLPDSKCIERTVCEIAAGSKNSQLLNTLLEELQRKYRTDVDGEPSTLLDASPMLTEEELLKASKGVNCSSYICEELLNL